MEEVASEEVVVVVWVVSTEVSDAGRVLGLGRVMETRPRIGLTRWKPACLVSVCDVAPTSELVVSTVVVVFWMVGAWMVMRVLPCLPDFSTDDMAKLEALATFSMASILETCSVLDVVSTSDLMVSMVVDVFLIAGAWTPMRVLFPVNDPVLDVMAMLEAVSMFDVVSTLDVTADEVWALDSEDASEVEVRTVVDVFRSPGALTPKRIFFSVVDPSFEVMTALDVT